ncbi:MAG: protein translocase subunit SecD [Candidatus Eutrophobiaceae bacterium]
MNKYALWKHILIISVILLGCIYALPNLYDQQAALRVSSDRGDKISDLIRYDIETALQEADIEIPVLELKPTGALLRFASEKQQLRVKEALEEKLAGSHTIALDQVSTMPKWLSRIGAQPMFLGLDLRGGVHFLMEVNMPEAVRKAENRFVSEIRTRLREEKIRYSAIEGKTDGAIEIRFRDVEERQKGQDFLDENFTELTHALSDRNDGSLAIESQITEDFLKETKKFALQQNITTLRKRVNELGVAEPVIQQQGSSRIVVQLPGVQDTTRAKEILGATATLEFRMVDRNNNADTVAKSGRVPPGKILLNDREGIPQLLDKNVILTGDRIIDAASGLDPQTGGPQVNITLDSKGAKQFSRATRDEIGNPMATVFIESVTETVEKDGKRVKKSAQRSEVINIATIQDELGKRFRITGLDSTTEARDLALLLRAGALAAPVEIIEERTVGPSLGQENIERGLASVIIGFIAVLIFMALYYRAFGIIANVALALNLVLILAMLSSLQAALTLPGIAGIVLTVGMAVDANVLIFERIRAELLNGNTPQASIYAGYEKAFSTIADANITTLIAALVLFSFGTGPIKGFAVTLSLGIISSMFTAIMVTRALVNLLYGSKPRLGKLAI